MNDTHIGLAGPYVGLKAVQCDVEVIDHLVRRGAKTGDLCRARIVLLVDQRRGSVAHIGTSSPQDQ